MDGWSKFIKLIGEERFSTDLAAQLINPNALGGEDDNDEEDDAGGTIPVTGVSNGMAGGADINQGLAAALKMLPVVCKLPW